MLQAVAAAGGATTPASSAGSRATSPAIAPQLAAAAAAETTAGVVGATEVAAAVTAGVDSEMPRWDTYLVVRSWLLRLCVIQPPAVRPVRMSADLVACGWL